MTMGFESEPDDPENTDVFGSQSVKNVSNETNLAGHYAYSPERWRLFDGDKATGTRLAPEYDDVPEYNHVGDYHELKPSGGQTVVFESAERYRYVVNFETEVSFTPRINQELQGDDYVRSAFTTGPTGGSSNTTAATHPTRSIWYSSVTGAKCIGRRRG